MEKNIELKNKIDPVVYNEFRDMVGWGTLLPEQTEAVLSNSICFSLECEGETIAITRVLWDGGYTAYIADVIVHEKHRGHGIGKKNGSICTGGNKEPHEIRLENQGDSSCGKRS